MHHKMPFSIKSWWLALLAVLGIGFFCFLGTWQLSRAYQKETLLSNFQARMQKNPLKVDQLSQTGDLRFYLATLSGEFDNAHTLLLDNKTFHGQVGYQIYTPFHAEGLASPILVDRGFIPRGATRQHLPLIKPIQGRLQIKGLLNLPPAYFALGDIFESKTFTWPLRVQYLELQELRTALPYDLFPYILSLTPTSSPYPIEWRIVITGPEKHRGYAFQWFALALTLLILFVALNWNRDRFH